MKRALALLLALLLVIPMAACQTGNPSAADSTEAPAPTATQEPQEVQNAAEGIIGGKEYLKVYKTSFSSSYSSFNYFSTAYSTVRSIVSNCIDGLVEPDIYGVYVPSIAESWETNEDQTVWTFKIREGVSWVDHEGKDTGLAVTAEDFVDGIRYIGDPQNDAYSLRVVRNLIEGLYDYYWNLDDIDDPEVQTDLVRDEVIASFDKTCLLYTSPSPRDCS